MWIDMPRNPPSIHGLLAAGLLLLLPLAAGADVFSILGERWNGWIPVGGLPWKKAYEAEMIVNDKHRVMHLYSARFDEPVLAQLNHVLQGLGAKFTYSATADGLTGVARKDGFEVRVLVSSPGSEPRHLIFLTYVDPNGRRKIKDPVAPYPNGEKLSSVVNLKTETTYFSYKTPDTPMEIHQFYERTLLADGWERMTPPAFDRASVEAMAVFQKKKQVCHIQVRQRDGFSSTIAVLVKKGSM
ncbi:hypothetical protein [Pontiella sp.]|uniref:hypothetical protein n=1 Tax=Pontiella sp. TaxID=2837462 RepID=UPI0035694848